MNARLRMQMYVGPSNDGGIAVAPPHGLVGLLHAHHRPRAGRVDGHGGTLRVQPVRDAV